MNLTKAPTAKQLQALLARANDDDGHHILWVDKTGNVQLTLIPEGLTPAGWEERNKGNIQFRLESFACGNQLVGPRAAADPEHIARLYQALRYHWGEGDRELVGSV